MSADGVDLIPTGVLPGRIVPTALGVAPGLRIDPSAARAKARTIPGLPVGNTRWRQRRRRALRERSNASARGLHLAPPQRTTTGDFVGLCLLVQFPDVPRTIAREEVDAFCNNPGYRGFDNNGSVYDYFYDISRGKLRYNTVITEYYTARHPRSYYTNPQVRQPIRAWELIKEALAALRSRGFDFNQLTVDDERCVYALNVFYAGDCVNRWSEGLWPHSYSLQTPVELAPGVFAYDYQFTHMGPELTLGTYCHENGHMICDFPDLYDYGYESSGAGAYCLMCSGANVDPKNPAHVGAYLKYRAGWADRVTVVEPGMRGVLRAGFNEFLIHARSQTEYYLIENRLQRGRDASLPGAGLAIWHVDEAGDNGHEQMTPRDHYECALVQADGRFDLERRQHHFGDVGDLFGAPAATRFGPDTVPSSAWWDGTPSGLEIHDISAPGQSIELSTKLR
ncbi:M6 family metalloprotease domain-containing protein [Sorangium sp. So ce542]|uniref:M6 family metalloprotease domain-containing protein n=1 Tax=Sorangium sp. So ce542 TaxID=3133316 RepID=UPI003F60B576